MVDKVLAVQSTHLHKKRRVGWFSFQTGETEGSLAHPWTIQFDWISKLKQGSVLRPGSKSNVDGASEMAQPVKAIAAKPDHLSSVPETHMVEGDDWLLWLVLWPTQVSSCMSLPLAMYIYKCIGYKCKTVVNTVENDPWRHLKSTLWLSYRQTDRHTHVHTPEQSPNELFSIMELFIYLEPDLRKSVGSLCYSRGRQIFLSSKF